MTTHLILCSHNGEKYIEYQIESILQQDKKIDCLHIFDFNSTDATINILEKIIKNNPNYCWNFHQKNDAPGAAASFFLAMHEVATYVHDEDCVFLCDQDDVWKKNKVAEIFRLFQEKINATNNKNLLIFHDVAITDEHLNIIKKTFYTGNPYLVPRDLAVDRVLLCNPIIGHTMAFSGALLQAVAQTCRSTNYLMHDWAITLLASRIGSIYYIKNTSLSFYRQHNNNVLGTGKKRTIQEKTQRTYFFSKNIILQINDFFNDFSKTNYPNQYKIDRWFIKIINQKYLYWLIYPSLAILALARGPTWQRKLLFLFILLHWII